VYEYKLHTHINELLQKNSIDIAGSANPFCTRFIANATAIDALYKELYQFHPDTKTAYEDLLTTIIKAYKNRSEILVEKDQAKEKKEGWFLSNQLAGMSLYVDRFCGSIKDLKTKIDYFKNLGVNLLHLMPLFKSPQGESDGGYAVSDFRTVDSRFGTLDDLKNLQQKMSEEEIYLMIDIVLNHTSRKHEWAEKAKRGDKKYQDYFYFFDDRKLPDEFEKTMPEIFPEGAAGNFTYVPEIDKWVMTVFHNYQWDLNYTNPHVLVEMLDTIMFYANLGVDILRIDAPAFIWKQLGTSCQNLPQAHTILRLIKQCVQVAAPGMALLGEAIVAPKEIMKYFGTGLYAGRECDFAYDATQMAVQWDALATGNTRILLSAQHEILQKPYGSSWITYTRCHDDIGLGYDDYLITNAGFNAFEHRKFLKNYYAGENGSPASGALFSVNPKTQDARISGSLASLCGLEKAINANDEIAIDISIKKILLMQAMSFFIGGVPMIFYGDETGYTNDYSYLNDPGKSYDSRWMHRPIINWEKNKRSEIEGTIEQRIFSSTKKLIEIRKQIDFVADLKNLTWLAPQNVHVVSFMREHFGKKLFCVFNFSNEKISFSWHFIKDHVPENTILHDPWQNKKYTVDRDDEYLMLEPYDFYLFEVTVIF
jgi:amylosucrase